MADVKVLDVLDNVEFNKDRLRQHCLDNGKYVKETESLDNIVTANNSINLSDDEKLLEIREIDYDGTILRTRYVPVGTPATYPDYEPTPNDDRLVFDKWICTSDADAYTTDMDYGALYKCAVEKEVNGVIDNPTIMDCYFDSTTGLSPSILIYRVSGTVYIDWGDGVVDEIASGSSVSKKHTYTSDGYYTIQVYSDGEWHFQTTTSNALFGSTTANRALLKCIFGKSITGIRTSIFNSCYSLTSVALKDGMTFGSGSGDGFDSVFSSCRSLKCIILPKIRQNYGDGFVHISNYFFNSCYSLQYIVIENGWDIINGATNPLFDSCYSLRKIILPDSITKVTKKMFNTCCALETIIMSDNVLYVADQPFYYCHSLKNIRWSKNIATYDTQTNPSNTYLIKDYYIANSMTKVPSYFIESYNVEEIIVPENISIVEQKAFFSKSLKRIIFLGNPTIHNTAIQNSSGLNYVKLPKGHNTSLNFSASYSLTEECLIEVANNLADLTGVASQTITLSSTTTLLLAKHIYLNSNGERVDKDTEGAVNLITFMNNKNWTVA